AGPLLIIGEQGLRQAQIALCIHQAGGGTLDTFHQVSPRMYDAETLHELLFGANGLLVANTASTVFLDDLAALPPPLLRRLALLLVEECWRAAHAGARLICGDFEEAGVAGAREALAYGLDERLRPGAFRLKPLRERSEDIPGLVKLYAERLAQRLGRGEIVITPDALALLAAYDWRENLDELETVLESVIRHTPPTTIDEDLLPPRIRCADFRRIPAEGFSLKETVEQFEKSLIATALQQAGGVQTRAAQLLGLRIQTLNMKLKRFRESPVNGNR
ncbi:MAG: helix-turn-helix domain-containing protein, partial [Blastocatellia bacterium]